MYWYTVLLFNSHIEVLSLATNFLIAIFMSFFEYLNLKIIPNYILIVSTSMKLSYFMKLSYLSFCIIFVSYFHFIISLS